MRRVLLLFVAQLFFVFSVGMDNILCSVLVDRLGIAYSVVGLISSATWVFSLLASFVALVGVSAVLLYVLSLVLTCLGYLSFMLTGVMRNVAVWFVLAGCCITTLGFGLNSVAVYSLAVELSRQRKSLSVSVYETVRSAAQVVAPLAAPLAIAGLRSVSFSYSVPLVLCLLGLCAAVFLPRRVAVHVDYRVSLSHVRKILRTRALLRAVLLVVPTYVAWFMFLSYDLLIALRNGHFTSMDVAMFSSTMFLTMAVLMTSVGHLCDRLGKRWIFIIISELLASAYVYIFYLAVIHHAITLLLLSAFLSGLSTCFWNTSLTPYIDELRGDVPLSQVLGFLGVVYKIVTIPAVALAGLLLEKSLVAYFHLLTMLFLVMAILHLVALPRNR